MTFGWTGTGATTFGSWGPSPPPPGAPKEQVLEYRLEVTQRRVKELSQSPKMLGVVLALEEDKAIVLCGGAATVECARPTGMDVKPRAVRCGPKASVSRSSLRCAAPRS